MHWLCKIRRHDWEYINSIKDERILKVYNYKQFWQALFDDWPVFYIEFRRCKRCGLIDPPGITGLEDVVW